MAMDAPIDLTALRLEGGGHRFKYRGPCAADVLSDALNLPYAVLNSFDFAQGVLDLEVVTAPPSPDTAEPHLQRFIARLSEMGTVYR